MVSEIFNSEMLWNSFMKGIGIAFQPMMPFIITGIVGLIIAGAIKHFVYNYALISGDSRRTAKRKAKTAGELINLVSSVNDIMGNKK
jgi:hypothetical protein